MKIAPSILSADFAHLAEQIRLVENAGADFIHLDVMDGHFVPNISFGPVVIRNLRKETTLPFDAHLMITDPDRYLEDFKKAGVNILTVHQEACTHLHRTIQRIKHLGMKAGVALNPATPLEMVEEILPDIDLLLIMTVNPGFGGQAFIETMLSKIERAARLLETLPQPVELEIDGGIDARTAEQVTRAGATVLVSGSAIFQKEDIPGAVREILARGRVHERRI
ncbi:MAG: ribulose-phosphate 3-epimerase [Calditrichaeota bacterium]|nr:ribulose-phosphate 3-epimerase [Calditrichota bacterium]